MLQSPLLLCNTNVKNKRQPCVGIIFSSVPKKRLEKRFLRQVLEDFSIIFIRLKMETLQAIKYDCGQLEILDQLLLPQSCTYLAICSVQDAWKAIREMKVTLIEN